METSTLITILIVLLVFLIPLLVSYLVYPDEKAKKHIIRLGINTDVVEEQVTTSGVLSFEQISAIFANSKSTEEELRDAIEQLVRHHGKIHAKLGDLPHPDFKRYLRLIMQLCKHPQANKDLIVALDQKLGVKNPKYRREIDEAVDKGIAAREK